MDSSDTILRTIPEAPPDHMQLPDEDGSMASNLQEHPQSSLLCEALRPRLRELYGDQFCVGCDSLIYWRYTEGEPLKGSKAPDWFLIPGVLPTLDGEVRRSYVLWREGVRPLLVIEYVSGDGSEERDMMPQSGKMWVYENGIAAAYYVIFDPFKKEVEAFGLVREKYERIEPTPSGRIVIPPLRIELGVWEGKYQEMESCWLRPWDAHTGQLMSLAEERAEKAEERADTAEAALDETRILLDEQAERAKKLASKLREMGIDPDTL